MSYGINGRAKVAPDAEPVVRKLYKVLPCVVRRWAITQKVNVLQQLIHGIRWVSIQIESPRYFRESQLILFLSALSLDIWIYESVWIRKTIIFISCMDYFVKRSVYHWNKFDNLWKIIRMNWSYSIVNIFTILLMAIMVDWSEFSRKYFKINFIRTMKAHYRN